MRSAALFVVLATVLTSCGGAAAPDASPSARATSGASPAGTAAASPGATAAPTAIAGPAFLSATLTDVRTGETFRIGAFPGKVVLVIAMAVW